MKAWLPAIVIIVSGAAAMIAFEFVDAASSILSEWSVFGLTAKLFGLVDAMEKSGEEIFFMCAMANIWAGWLLVPCIVAGAMESKLRTRKPNFVVGSLVVGVVFVLINSRGAYWVIPSSGYAMALPFLAASYFLASAISASFDRRRTPKPNLPA